MPGGKLGLGPAFFIPPAAQNPSAPRGVLRLQTEAPDKFVGGGCIFEVDVFQLQSAVNEMQVRVVESRQQEPAIRFDHLRVPASPQLDLGLTADRHDAIAEDCHRFGLGPASVTGPHRGPDYNQVCRRAHQSAGSGE